MKRLLKNIPLMLLMFALMSACGENKSGGGGSSSKGNSGGGINSGDTGYTTQGENHDNINEVRNSFSAKGLDKGISNGETIYHVGSLFGGSQTGGGQVSGGIYGCLNLIFWEVGDCDDNGSGGTSAYLQNALNLGRIWRIENTASSIIDVDEAYQVVGNEYVYQAVDFNKDNSIYRKMLGLDLGDNIIVKVSNASIKLTNNTSIPATYVEYFKTTYTSQGQLPDYKISSYILTTNLAVIANPVLSTTGSNNLINGYLSNIGQNIQVKSVTVDKQHYVYKGYQNGQFVRKIIATGQQTQNLRY